MSALGVLTSNLIFAQWDSDLSRQIATAAAIDRRVPPFGALEFDVPVFGPSRRSAAAAAGEPRWTAHRDHSAHRRLEARHRGAGEGRAPARPSRPRARDLAGMLWTLRPPWTRRRPHPPLETRTSFPSATASVVLALQTNDGKDTSRRDRRRTNRSARCRRALIR